MRETTLEPTVEASSGESRTRSWAGPPPPLLHPAWLALIRLCREIRHGEIDRLVIQDGLPVFAETTRKKVKLI